MSKKRPIKDLATDLKCDIYNAASLVNAAVVVNKGEREYRKDTVKAATRSVQAVCHDNEVYFVSRSKKGWKLYKIISGEEKEKVLFSSSESRKILDIAISEDELFLLMEGKQDKSIFEIYAIEIGDTKNKPTLIGAFSANTKVTLEPFQKYPGGWIFGAIKEELKQDFPCGGLCAFSFHSKQLCAINVDEEHPHFKQVGNYIFFEDGTSAVLP